MFTAEKVFKLADRISSEEALRRLADRLGMTDEMEECLAEEWGVAEAAYMTLTSWVKSQPNRTSAFTSMCQTLEEVDMAEFVMEIK